LFVHTDESTLKFLNSPLVFIFEIKSWIFKIEPVEKLAEVV